MSLWHGDILVSFYRKVTTDDGKSLIHSCCHLRLFPNRSWSFSGLTSSFHMLTATLEQKDMIYPAVDLNTKYVRLNCTWTLTLLTWVSESVCVWRGNTSSVSLIWQYGRFCFSRDHGSSSSPCHCSLRALPSHRSALCSACWSRLSACLKLNPCQSLVDSRSLWIIASYLLLRHDGKGLEGKWGLLLKQAVRDVYWRVRQLWNVFSYI